MSEDKSNLDDAKLSRLLQESRAQPALPPRFQQAVWRRIEEADAADDASHSTTWLDAFVARMLRPRFAMAAALVLVVAGSLAGVSEGRRIARQQAETRYISSVAPDSLRQ